MKIRNPSSHKAVVKGRPDYYISPSHDFTQYTRDSEEKYWSKDTKFNWNQSVRDSLKENLENLETEELSKILFMVLPMVEDSIGYKIIQIGQERLPLEEDALKDIAECIPCSRTTIHQALMIQLPLRNLQVSVLKLQDQYEIVKSELVDLQEQQRLGFFKEGIRVKRVETEVESLEQSLQLSRMKDQLNQIQSDLQQLNTKNKTEVEIQKTKIREVLNSLEAQVLLDLQETQQLVHHILQQQRLPTDQHDLALLKDLVLKRQLRALKDIANHALVVEQSAIAPLTMGIIHYKRYREIQEAMTTFIRDESKHSATFRRYLVEKLEAKEFISAILIKGADRYMWLARFMPGAGLFLAVIVEVIGASYLEFFGKEEYMPEKLFCSICKTIATQDEKRHMDLCVGMYNELFRTGKRWERYRNKMALKVLMKSVYGDKKEDHHLIQAFRAFGVESEFLYRHITTRLSQQLARVSVYVEPEELLEIIGVDSKRIVSKS